MARPICFRIGTHLLLLFSFIQCVVHCQSQNSDASHKLKLAEDGQTTNDHGGDNERPHIIFIMADDAGWNDFSFHGSAQIPTPNIDALALTGMILNRYYVSPLCTPTRGAIMSGKHPIHLGLQHYVVRGASSGGLPLTEKILPAYLKDLGYDTHLVGKWHLGHSKTEYLPTSRGFDTHYGYWLGKGDYYSHISIDGKDSEQNVVWGYDFVRNTTCDRPAFGSYVTWFGYGHRTDLLTKEAVRLVDDHTGNKPLFIMLNHMAPHSAHAYDPLQAQKERVKKFKNIDNENRQAYAALIDSVDESVGTVVEALSRKGILSKSIIVFASDNGAAPDGYDKNYGSNWPLRGIKNTLWEGGTRVAAMIWSPLVQNRVSTDLMHAQDWLPTLYEAAGSDPTTLKGLDGRSMWKTLTEGVKSPRDNLLYNIDGPYNNAAVRDGPWKLMLGVNPTGDLGVGDWNFWHGEYGQESGSSSELLPAIIESVTGKTLTEIGYELNRTKMRELQKDAQVVCNREGEDISKCDLSQAPCLFHVDDDPCELWNVADKEPEQVKHLLELISEFNKTAIQPMSRFLNPNAFPQNWGNEWTTWETKMADGLCVK